MNKKLIILTTLIVVSLSINQPVNAKWSGWTDWSFLGSDIYWMVNSEPTSSGCEYRLKFSNRTKERVKIRYTIVNGYGGEDVSIASGQTKKTSNNYTKHDCVNGIQIDWKFVN